MVAAACKHSVKRSQMGAKSINEDGHGQKLPVKRLECEAFGRGGRGGEGRCSGRLQLALVVAHWQALASG